MDEGTVKRPLLEPPGTYNPMPVPVPEKERLPEQF